MKKWQQEFKISMVCGITKTHINRMKVSESCEEIDIERAFYTGEIDALKNFGIISLETWLYLFEKTSKIYLAKYKELFDKKFKNF